MAHFTVATLEAGLPFVLDGLDAELAPVTAAIGKGSFGECLAAVADVQQVGGGGALASARSCSLECLGAGRTGCAKGWGSG